MSTPLLPDCELRRLFGTSARPSKRSIDSFGDGDEIDADSDVVKKKKGALSTKATAVIKPGAVGAAEVAVSVKSNRCGCAGRDRCVEVRKSRDEAR